MNCKAFYRRVLSRAPREAKPGHNASAPDGVIPKTRVLTSGARDPACSGIEPAEMFSRHRQTEVHLLQTIPLRSSRDPSLAEVRRVSGRRIAGAGEYEEVQTIPRLPNDESAPFACAVHGHYWKSEPSRFSAQEQACSRIHQPL